MSMQPCLAGRRGSYTTLKSSQRSEPKEGRLGIVSFAGMQLVIAYSHIISNRCPMECIMRKTPGPWHCSISLRDDDAAGVSTPFGPERITDRSSVEIWLRRAQAACLSPHRSPTEFHDMSKKTLKTLHADDPSTLKFTSRVVCLTLDDPDATDLAFVDLPGLLLRATFGFQVADRSL